MTEKEFAKYIGPLANADMQKSGVLASVTAAQCILESGYGRTELARTANNFFGMKCVLSGNTWGGSTWDGTSKANIRTPEDDGNGNIYYINADFRKYTSITKSIADHSAYLLGAMNGNKKRYEGLKNEMDSAKAIHIIKVGGYATDTKYESKILSIISRFELAQYDATTEKESEVTNMKIVESILTKNPCYEAGRKIAVKGLMLHSVGCPQPKASVFISKWNTPSYSKACVHGFIDANNGIVYQTLPWNHRGWHCGSGSKGSGNNTHIGVEMCEPDCIKYTSGSSFTCSNTTKAKAMVKRTYESAVQLFAYLCKKYGLNPLADGIVISHREGHSRGIASNHGDPEHLWNGLGMGYTMNTFRKAVKAAMDGEVPAESASTPTSELAEKKKYYRVRKSWADVASQKGAFETLDNAKEYADKNSGYIVYDWNGKQVYPKVFKQYIVSVAINNLNIRRGPGINYGKLGYLGKGTFTIVKEEEGPGAKLWGLLKSYKDSKNGWISLDYTDFVRYI